MNKLPKTLCGVFRDRYFQAMPEYDSGDVEDLLGSSGIICTILNHKDIETLKRKSCDILILPYVRGYS